MIGRYLRKKQLIIRELGCAMVLILLATIVICTHTLITLIYIFYGNKSKDEDYLVGGEDGCCGFMAIGLSTVSEDEPIKSHSKAAKRRAGARLITIGVQVPIIVVCCSALMIIGRPEAWYSQKTSVFAFVTVLMLHITNLIENVYEGLISFYS